MPPAMLKYPRTMHIEGSRLQPGDEDLACVPFARIAGRALVVEEKVDGANAAVSFDEDGVLWLQSRGHYLTGGAREAHFAMFKQWAGAHADVLRARLGARYVLYGEWLYAKHTIFYDALPHYFLEFDVLDRDTGGFLSTPRRRALLAGAPVASVPVLLEGSARKVSTLVARVATSLYKTPAWRDHLVAAVRERGLDVDRALRETDASDLAEGLYIKVEEQGRVVERFKWVRASFATAIRDSESHWQSRPIVPNALVASARLYPDEA